MPGFFFGRGGGIQQNIYVGAGTRHVFGLQRGKLASLNRLSLILPSPLFSLVQRPTASNIAHNNIAIVIILVKTGANWAES